MQRHFLPFHGRNQVLFSLPWESESEAGGGGVEGGGREKEKEGEAVCGGDGEG